MKSHNIVRLAHVAFASVILFLVVMTINPTSLAFAAAQKSACCRGSMPPWLDSLSLLGTIRKESPTWRKSA